MPSTITHHWVVIPNTVCLASRSFDSEIQPSEPVAAPIVDSPTGTANVSANHALNPTQKKISQIP